MGKSKKKLANNRKRSQSSPPQETARSSRSSSRVEEGGSNRSSTAIAGTGGNVPLRKNPFDIPVIVRKIMGHLNKVNDLKGFRLMSRACLDESLGMWRDTAVFGLRYPQAERALKHTMGLDNAAHPHNSQAPPPVTLYRLEEKPFKNYKLKPGLSYPPTIHSVTNPHTLHFFWENCGPSVKYLDLSDCYFKEGLHLEGLKWVLGSCPNIEEIKLAPYKTNLLMDYLSKNEYRPSSFHDLKFMQDIKWWRSHADEKKAGKKFKKKPDMFRTAPLFSICDKLQSLSIDYSEFDNDRSKEMKELFKGSENLCADFLGLMPNLTTFSISHMDHPDNIWFAFAAMNRRPIHLEKCVQSRTYKSNQISLKGLKSYLAIAEQPKLKILELHGIHFNNEMFWESPYQLKDVLMGVKKDVEDLNLSFDCKRIDRRSQRHRYNWIVFDFDFEYEMRISPSFDLFDVKFSKLTKLKLVFDYCKANIHVFTLNFGLFRGTRSLKYFHFGTKGCNRDLYDWKQQEEGLEDLVQRTETSWYRDNRGVMRRNGPPSPSPLVPDEDPVLPEDEIVLDQLKEFHYEGTLSGENWQLLGQWMKNLEVLETILDDDTFTVPFQVWGRGAEGGKLRKLTVFMFEEGQVRKELVSKQEEINPEVEIRLLVQRKRGEGWTKNQEVKCTCGKYFDHGDEGEFSSED